MAEDLHVFQVDMDSSHEMGEFVYALCRLTLGSITLEGGTIYTKKKMADSSYHQKGCLA